ncbi:MAG: hypothetical protein ABSF64_35745 [Bryobacteraceae bacterium]|jgi:hypothetical protein
MSFRGVGCAVAALLATQPALLAQAAKTPRHRVANFESLPQAPVPNDPLELVTGDAQPVQNAEQRAVATGLLKKARDATNVRAYAYDLKTTFVSSGASEGAWSLEDTSPSRGVYRWTAQGPSYSATNLYSNELLYGNQAAGTMPLRLAQVRAAIFFAYQEFGPYATLRTATGSLNGAEVSCVLVSHSGLNNLPAGARRWEESEYCMDSKSGVLMRYSPVPGVFVSYDYTNAFHFHDKAIPGKFTITIGGQSVAEARTESVKDPGAMDPALFQPAGLEKIGVGSLMTRPWKIRTTASGSGNTQGALQFVVLDGMVTPDGQMGEVQVVASSNAALNQSALDKAAAFRGWQTAEDAQPGATPLSHEVFFTVQFVPSEP